ncbi:MAG: BTAD domain-containing putative transcriptional regulator [Gemmatimonadota bacterium]
MISFHVLGTLRARDGDDTGLTSLLTGPKRIALLTYLALASPRGFHRRDTLLALFWPDLDQAHARASLRNLLYQIRQAAGPDLIQARGDDEIGLAEGALWCDAMAFEEALTAGRLSEALELYRGDLLEGFFVRDASAEFELWLESERARLRRRASEAAAAMTEQAAREGNTREATRWARRAVAFDPYNESTVRRQIVLLDQAGDRAGALGAYRDFADQLATEFEAEPSAETRALITRIRAREEVRHPTEPARKPGDTASPGGHDSPPRPAQASPSPRGRPRRRALLASAFGVLIVAVIAVLAARTSPESSASMIAIGEIRNYADTDTTHLGMLGNMISTNLARAPGLSVLSAGRMYELARMENGRGGLQSAARRAGADEIIEGTLYFPGDDGKLRLELRRIDLSTGVVREAYRVEGEDPFALVDRATALVLADFDLPSPVPGIASVTTSSLVAYRFYEEGLRAYYDGDTRAAQRFLTASLAEDSSFAMAAYYRALSHKKVDHAAFRRDLKRAKRLADRASERERLLIQTAWARVMDEPRQLTLAESLVRKYPSEPDGHLFLGEARLWSGDFMGALPYLQGVVVMDSTSLRAPNPACRACDAMRDIVTAYLLADSLPAAEREARKWVALQRDSALAWRSLAWALEYQGRAQEAQVARSMASSLGSDNPRDPVHPAVLALREGDFTAADSWLAQLDRAVDPLVRQNVLWYRVLSLRYQGRFAQALEVARDYRRMIEEAAVTGHPAVWAPILEAQVLVEMGRPGEAAELWEAMAVFSYEPDSPSRSARHRAWTLTHTATALAAAGETGRLPTLADTIETLGSLSAYGRDPRLHHYVRGLVHAADGDVAAAVSDYRRAIFSTTAGYAPINLALGKALLALDRPKEAIPVLGGALRGPLDAGNLYANRTAIHALLARAFEAAGQADSAAFHEQWVSRARIEDEADLAEGVTLKSR